MKYATLGIILHQRCNASCDMCSLRCTPQSTAELDEKRLKEIIDSCTGTTIKNVSFTGGEPFLRYKILRSLVKHATDHGMTASVVTNGFWASDLENAKRKVGELKSDGVKYINISHDYHHRCFIPTESVKNLIKACDALGVPCVVAMCKLKDERVGDLVDEMSSISPTLKTTINACQQAGSAKDMFDDDQFDRPVAPKNLKCQYGGILTIHCSGKIFPCCGHAVFETALSVGNYMDIDIPEALRRIKNNSLLYALRNYGLDPFIEQYREIALRGKTSFTCECDICANLFSGKFAYMQDYVNQLVGEKNAV